MPGCQFPSKHLAGVGVIFYVMMALRRLLRGRDWFAERGLKEPNMAQFLDLVALGTVADVVPLDHNNRILVEQGIRRIRAGHANAGIAALLAVAGRNPQRLVASDLGFAVGPRLNAAGRLDDMSLGIECLLADDGAVAARQASHLDELNRERREIESRMRDQALEAVAQLQSNMALEALPVALCLYDPQWHQGVIGVVASRIKDQFHRPVVAFAPGNEGELKGSARSVPGLHIRDVLAWIDAHHPGLVTKFGGHAMAAGLLLPTENLPSFRDVFIDTVRTFVDEDDLRGVLHSDGALSAEELTLDVAELLRWAGPWGQGFPEPLFDGEFKVLKRRIVGERHLKLVLQTPEGRGAIDAIAFNVDPDRGAGDSDHIRVAYRLDANEYRGLKSPQLVIEHIEPV
jgi:single-stranded-DNA-specific exonuclease